LKIISLYNSDNELDLNTKLILKNLKHNRVFIYTSDKKLVNKKPFIYKFLDQKHFNNQSKFYSYADYAKRKFGILKEDLDNEYDINLVVVDTLCFGILRRDLNISFDYTISSLC